MRAPQDNQQAVAGPRARSRSRTIAGVALMLLGVAVMAYGAHYVTKNGNCSGTGYTSYGPVAKCSGGEALYITSVFFLGPALAVVGWLLAGVSGVLWPAFCIAMAVGLITLRDETTITAGARAFCVVIGEVFVVLAVVSVIVSVRKRRRPKAAPAGIAGTGTVLAGAAGLAAPTGLSGPGTGTTASPSEAYQAGPPVTGMAAGPDPLDTIAKLARLRDGGAITDEEYERQKTKLLGQL